MPVKVFGLNHKSAPVSVREKLSGIQFASSSEIDGFMLEAVPVFTCNRVEIYYSGAAAMARKHFAELLLKNNLVYEELADYFYELSGEEAAFHLFSVASGIDSMVIGESQILHQLKEAYKQAIKNKFVGKQLHKLFQKALEVGKKVRSETLISSSHTSIASTAIELAVSLLGSLTKASALVIGAGETARLVSQHLKKYGIKSITFINRTESKAIERAKEFGGRALPFEQLKTALCECDMAISCTAAPKAVVSQETIQSVMQSRGGKKLYIIDIAVPRDFEPTAAELEGVCLFNLDKLQSVVDNNISHRRAEAKKARSIIKQEAKDFMSAEAVYNVAPLITLLQENADKTRKAELKRFFGQHRFLTDEQKKAFEQCTYSLMGKWLHGQIMALKGLGEADLEQILLVRDILGLNSSAKQKSKQSKTEKKTSERGEAA